MPIEDYVVAMGAKRGQGQKKPLQGPMVARDYLTNRNTYKLRILLFVKLIHHKFLLIQFWSEMCQRPYLPNLIVVWARPILVCHHSFEGLRVA